jgi:hypothetical protein
MKFRKLRIAWSVGCGLVCLLLIVLWVRSYSVNAFVIRDTGVHRGFIGSRAGKIGFQWLALELKFRDSSQWQVGTDSVSTSDNYSKNLFRHFDFVPPPSYALGFQWRKRSDGWEAELPMWFPVVVASLLVSIPWINTWRFSLRTLLIATTLVAVLLGVVIYAVR